jgi:simple sugar transport system permease protein
MDWSNIFSLTFLVNVLAAGVALGAPLIATALGEIYAERSGVYNLGVEGIMLLGGFSSFAVAYWTGNLWFGVLTALLVGALIGLVFSLWVVTIQTNQVVTGFAMLILCNGAAIYFYRLFFPTSQMTVVPQVHPFPTIAIPVLSQIPIIGTILFKQDAIVYLIMILAIISSIIQYRTRFGLRTSAVGEAPAAADILGINVPRLRYINATIGAALAGLGGAYFSLVVLGFYSDTMIAGRGFVALALVIFGRWDPFWVIAGGVLFGTFDALQFRLQILNAPVPSQFLIMAPYGLTILMLLVGRKRQPPAALTQPYARE